jgi:hypothetical protein
MTQFKQGERIKLTKRAAKGRNKSQHPGRVDWSARRGVIQRVNWGTAFVIWDGLKSEEAVSLNAIEPSA